MSVKIGVSPISWTNDDMPELGRDTTVEHCLQEGKQAGYSGFELGGKWPRETSILEPLFNKYNMDVISSWFCGGLLKDSIEVEIKRITPHMQLLKDLGTDVIVYCEMDACVHGDISSPLSMRPTLSEDQWQDWTDKLNQLAKYTLSHGMQLAYHHHMGTIVQIEEEVDKLMAMTNKDLGLVLDTGHLIYAGSDPLKVYEKYSDRVLHIHCKDVRGAALDDSLKVDSSFLNSVLNGVFTVPGDGDFDFPGLFKMVSNNEYSGWIVVEAEQDPAKAHPLTYVTMGYKNIESYCEKFGIQIEKKA
jgi:inosose dehydratase|tara:strand:+ start:2641 stop:3546 length:906 start_codon:yes stop_codon:yes gene_type:complete